MRNEVKDTGSSALFGGTVRVISGELKGRKLFAPDGLDIRPTSDMVKEAIFSILMEEIPGAAVLDLFAGTGQLGIESLSRGAREAVFVDSSKTAIAAIKKNLSDLKITSDTHSAHVVMSDFKTYLLSESRKFDIVIIDPPYEKGLAAAALEVVSRVLSENALVICETALNEPMPDSVGVLSLVKSYRYGRKQLHKYENCV